MLLDNHTVIIAIGRFDPIHNGHIHFLTEAKKLGDRLIVALELDNCIIRKHGISFMNWEERAPIMRALKPVDEVIMISECDNPYLDALRQVRRMYPSANLLFVSGQSKNNNFPTLQDDLVRFEYDVGGDFKASSSIEILRRYSEYVRIIKEMESGPYRRYE